MNRTKIIADTTRCYQGTEQHTANVIRSLCTGQHVSDSDLILISRADQPAIWQRFEGQAECVKTSMDILQAQGEASQLVLSALAKIVGNQECERVIVLSYNGRTLKAAAGFPAGGIDVSVHSFSNAMVISGRQAEHTWSFEHVIPLEDALRALSSALQRHACLSNPNGARQTDLRIMLAGEDTRFGGSSSTTGTVGMIAALVRLAAARGIICVDQSQFPNPRVWLAGSPHAVSSPSSARSNTGAVPMYLPPSDASIERPIRPETTEPVHSSEGHAAVETRTVPRAGKEQSDGEATTLPVPSRSTEFERCLATKDKGPYATCRPAMFAAVNELVPKNPGIFLLDLIDGATERAKAILLASPKTKDRATQHPWVAIGVFVANLLTQSRVLLGEDGSPIAEGFNSALAHVHSLTEDWQTKADAEILLTLLACRDDVSQYDMPILAGVLYHSRDKDAQAKVARAIAFLLASNRATEVQADGNLYLRANKDHVADAAMAGQPSP